MNQLNIIDKNWLETVQGLCDSICKTVGVDNVKIKFQNESQWHYEKRVYGYLMPQYKTIFFNEESMKRANKNGIKYKYSAYYRLNGYITPVEYIIMHELYHHISGLNDGKRFEDKLYWFIKQHFNKGWWDEKPITKNELEKRIKKVKEKIR